LFILYKKSGTDWDLEMSTKIFSKTIRKSIFPPENLVCAGGLSKFSPGL
jgi:hypothetical protein